MEQWRMRCLSGGGESKASSSMENKNLVSGDIFVFSHDESGEGGDDGVSDGLDGDNFIVFTCGRLVYPSFEKGLGFTFPPSEMWMTVVDGEMAVFVQIGVLVCGIPI
ncbi:hypothetical protein EJB05_27621, partial [Eragrostis curvula]